MKTWQQASSCNIVKNYIPAISNSTEEIQIDLAVIPNHVRDDLAATTFECVKNFLRQPGGREFLDARIAEKRRL